MDVARALYMDLTGQEVIPGVAPEGRKWIVEDQDLISCLRYHRDGNLTFKQWLQSFQGVEEGGFYAADDLYPCVTRLMALCGQALKRINPLSA
jgi:predicted ATP-grasp superfamily ATP-dependent carboligase